MSLLRVVVLGLVQGLAELLPVSSSAHVVVAEKLMHLNPSSPEMTLLLVMLHTGTMLAVIVYFWKRWKATLTREHGGFRRFLLFLVVATVITGAVGEVLIKIIERVWFRDTPHAEVEQLFSHLELIAPALALVGVLIIIAGVVRRPPSKADEAGGLDVKRAGLIGAVQGVCLPFRGFSRSGATISTAMLTGIEKVHAEEFSFALAVILTPPVVIREALRLVKAEHASPVSDLAWAVGISLFGALCAFIAGLVALKWLSRWLEAGRWYWFGIYCLLASAVVAGMHHAGY
ncbi:MAG: undecaprenyl-diphosphate phosphatase [Acidobacteria bacterium]|nr:undecaprenyl-diphosphate phosphatase [Acidobacteriota bacterium]